MKAISHKQLHLGSLFGKEIVGDFEGGRITSDGGGFVLSELDKRYGLVGRIADSLHDGRDRNRIVHEMKTLLKQRIFSIAMGYEDTNDANTLRRDPALKAISGRLPETSGDLASQPTLCRFENRVTRRDARQLAEQLFGLYVTTHAARREVIVIDIDSTDDPTHGHQQLSFFHGYYEEHMYHPLLVFDGMTGFLMACVLRPGNTHSSHRAVAVLKRIIKKLKRCYPGVPIVLRADAGFAVPALYRLCEKEAIHYVIGLIPNDRLTRKGTKLLARAKERFQKTQDKQRLFGAFGYRAGSWKRFRRVVTKAEYTDKGPNQRFVVTDLSLSPQRIYDDIYVLRGEIENRIKELKLELKADRLSCHRFLSNQFRLYLHVFAYTLFLLMRRHLEGTELEAAQVGTLRVKLLKIGARIREKSRRVWVHLASGYPYRALFELVLGRIRAAPI
jgi:hypothetical protein